MRKTDQGGGGWAESETYRPDDSAALAQRIHSEGLVYAANRLVFHPVGIALGVAGRGDAASFRVNGLALFRSNDPEGIVFAGGGQHERGMEKLHALGMGSGLRALAFQVLHDQIAELDVVDAEVIDETIDGALRTSGADPVRAKLDEMALHDDTGNERDEGYMAAVRELREWLDG